MKLIVPGPEELTCIVTAAYSVASAGGILAPEAIEVEAINAFQRHMLGQETPTQVVPGPLPIGLESVIADPASRRQLVRQLAILSLVDGTLRPEKVAVVADAARRLGVSEFGLTVLSQLSKRQGRGHVFGFMRRIVAHYWSFDGRATARDWLGMAWTAAPWLPGLGRYLGRDALLLRYRALGALPAGSFGRMVHGYYTEHGFPMPGEPKSLPEGWARHEIYHVLSGYATNLQGELLLAGFIAGNTEELCLDIVLPALIQLHVGLKFVPGPVSQGKLQPDPFFRAMARGAAMQVDLLAGWRLWDVAELPLDDVRRRYGIPALTAAEREELAPHKALLPA
jgi:hypothetical protein